MRTFSLVIMVTASFILFSWPLSGQKKLTIKNFPDRLPKIRQDEKTQQKYVMTAEYFNKDIYGILGSKVKVTGEYTRGLKDNFAKWNNVFIAHTNNPPEPYNDRVKQDYMENIRYQTTSDVLEESFFESFDAHTDNIFARNLIWDMTAIEGFAWQYFDSLQLNKTYIVPDILGSFDMAKIGTYSHNKIELKWVGISMMNNTFCALIEYRALDNKLELHTDQIKSKGSDMYWGKTWLSLENKQIEYAEMLSNTVQKMEIESLPNQILVSTLRILTLERIK